MKIIVGLGNPGKQYEKTRHNAGFLVLDQLVQKSEINSGSDTLNYNLDKKLKAFVAYTICRGEKVIFIKPDTFMNGSGIAVNKVMQYYKAEIVDLIVIADDKDLPLGEARVKLQGGSAGQKGIQSIIDELGSESFVRIRIGINYNPDPIVHPDMPTKLDTAEYVLQNFSDRELSLLDNVIEKVVGYLVGVISDKNQIEAMTIR